jgi:hypothetical protein
MVVFIDYDHDPLGKHSVKGPDAFQRPYVEPGNTKLSVGFELPPDDTSENPSAEASSGVLSSSRLLSV